MTENTLLHKHLSGLEFQTVKLSNGFVVSDFIIGANVDFAYSLNDNDTALLLNIEAFGNIDLSEVRKLIEAGHRTILVHNETMNMYVYNISEEDVFSVLLG